MTQFSDLLGKTLTEIIGKKGDEEIIFVIDDGKRYRLWHDQDCCETVNVEDIVGEFSGLIGSPLTMAEEVRHDQDATPEGAPAQPGEFPDESFTWTFYKLATINEYVTIRWYGTSNGYYAEGVDFDEVSNAT